MKTKTRKSLFERLKLGLLEGISHEQGEITLRTVEVPEDAPDIDGETLAAVRKEAAMSQAVFAGMLSVSPKTLQSWEQGNRQPSHASRRLIHVFIEAPEMMCRLTGLPEVHVQGVTVEVSSKGRRRFVIRKVRSKKGQAKIVKTGATDPR